MRAVRPVVRGASFLGVLLPISYPFSGVTEFLRVPGYLDSKHTSPTLGVTGPRQLRNACCSAKMRNATGGLGEGARSGPSLWTVPRTNWGSGKVISAAAVPERARSRQSLYQSIVHKAVGGRTKGRIFFSKNVTPMIRTSKSSVRCGGHPDPYVEVSGPQAPHIPPSGLQGKGPREGQRMAIGQ